MISGRPPTLRHVSALATRPSRKARLSEALRMVSVRFAVARHALAASPSPGSLRFALRSFPK